MKLIKIRYKIALGFTIITVIFSQTFISVLAQNLDSSNYTLVAPTIGNSTAGTSDSSNFSQLMSSGLIDSTRFESANFALRGGYVALIEPNVPKTACLETTTNFSNTNCTGVPGSDGMFAVCADPGCYNRAKLEIDTQNNPSDIRYAIQISTASDFSSNVFYVDSTTHFLKSNLTVADFTTKCDWEGTVVSGICASPNTTWQRYNILGLRPETQYYVRISAASAISGNNNFQQTEWGPSATITTAKPTITFDIDIAPDTSTNTNQPYNLDLGTLNNTSVNTSSDNIVLRTATNGLGGLQLNVKGNQGYLLNNLSSDQIPAYNGDLASNTGYGIRNLSSANAADNTTNIGHINVSSSPIDFTDTGAITKVGGPSTSYVKLFDSNNLPLDSGVAPFAAKARPSATIAPGRYTETLTFLVYATF